MLSRLQVAFGRRSGAAVPGYGVPIVFQQQMRGRRPVRDLLWMSALVLCHHAAALWLQSIVMPLSEYTSDAPRFLFRWLSMVALAGPLLYLPCAAVLGAMAVPPAARFEETQSLLLTRLTPFDLCTGRLLSWLWPVISATLASCVISLTVQLARRPLLPGTPAGYIDILLMHLALLTSAIFTGALAFLTAMRRRPGRVWERGAAFALIAAGCSVFGLLLADPIVRRMDNPTSFIYSMLLTNPAIAATSALQMDTLRLPWLYERTVAPEYPFLYPPALASCALFAGGAAGALGLSAARLRRAYR